MPVRSVSEWIGDHDDQPIPPRVKLRIVERYQRRCGVCTRDLVRGHFAFDHIRALVNGGQHRESNIQPLCDVPCHADKTGDDVALKSHSYKRRLSHHGIKRKKNKYNSFQTNRDGLFKKHVDGTVTRR